jgi:hypothetical protein
MLMTIFGKSEEKVKKLVFSGISVAGGRFFTFNFNVWNRSSMFSQGQAYPLKKGD